jgi:DNA-directed RNA polymerase specialized sigma24 family protein
MLVAFWQAAITFQPDGSSFRTWACKRVKSRLFDDIRDANADKHQPLNSAKSTDAPLLSESESEGEPKPLGDFIITIRGPDGVLRALNPRTNELPNEPEEMVIADETHREILDVATPREREAVGARRNGEPLDDAARQALHRLHAKLLNDHRHVSGLNGGYTDKGIKSHLSPSQ